MRFTWYCGNKKYMFEYPVTEKKAEEEKCRKRSAVPKKSLKDAAGPVINGIKDGITDTYEFIREMIPEIKEDVAAVRQRDPAARSNVEVLLLYSGLHAILAYRVAHRLYIGKKFFSARAVSQLSRFFTGIEIHPGATIGRGLFIDHGAGVVIGETCEIGDNCTLYQGVTLGGTGKDTGKRHPTLGNNVMIGAGAKVLGPFRIGDNTKIAAGAVVLKEIPDNSTAVGIPARVVRRGGIKVDENDGTAERIIAEELDQVNVPDPVSQQFTELETQLEVLKAEIEELKKSREAFGSDSDKA